MSTSFRTCNNFYRPNDAHLEACLVKVMHVVILNAVLSFSLLNKLKLRANYLRIFLEYSLTVLYLIKGYFCDGARARHLPNSAMLLPYSANLRLARLPLAPWRLPFYICLLWSWQPPFFLLLSLVSLLDSNPQALV